MTHVMIDLETLGTRPNAAIISIGACLFSESGFRDEFYVEIDLESSMSVGSVDASTIEWWINQKGSAKSVFSSADKKTLVIALVEFQSFVKNKCIDPLIWGNGAAFDNVILRSAFYSCGMTTPWSYKDDRCYRTLAALFPEIPIGPMIGCEHNALDDARRQADHAARILSHISSTRIGNGN